MHPWDPPSPQAGHAAPPPPPAGYAPPPTQQPPPPGPQGYYPPQQTHYPQGAPAGPAGGGGLAITAGVLALILALTRGYYTATSTVALYESWPRHFRGRPGWWRPYLVSVTVLSVIVTVALVIGAILLLSRRNSGRVLIAVSCATVIAIGILTVTATYLSFHSHAVVAVEHYLVGTPTQIVRTFCVTVLPVLTMIFVLLPPVRRWCQARRSRPIGYPPYR